MVKAGSVRRPSCCQEEKFWLVSPRDEKEPLGVMVTLRILIPSF